MVPCCGRSWEVGDEVAFPLSGYASRAHGKEARRNGLEATYLSFDLVAMSGSRVFVHRLSDGEMLPFCEGGFKGR